MNENPMTRYPIPLPGGREVTVEGPFPLTVSEWAQFMTVLEAMKPGLCREPGAEREADGRP